jgi:hypothetical protein
MESRDQFQTPAGEIVTEAVLRILRLHGDPRFDFEAAVRILTPEELKILAVALLNRSKGVR